MLLSLVCWGVQSLPIQQKGLSGMAAVKCRTGGRSLSPDLRAQARGAGAKERARTATLQPKCRDTLPAAGGGRLLTPHRLPSGERSCVANPRLANSGDSIQRTKINRQFSCLLKQKARSVWQDLPGSIAPLGGATHGYSTAIIG